nr:alpha-mannosidase isoform X1 [Tanacetum cinerariifolium]
VVFQVQGKFYIRIDPIGDGAKWRRTFGQEIYSPLLLAFAEQESIYKRPPTGFEFFLHTHTSGHDKKTFINEKSKTINDNVLRLRRERDSLCRKSLKMVMEELLIKVQILVTEEQLEERKMTMIAA